MGTTKKATALLLTLVLALSLCPAAAAFAAPSSGGLGAGSADVQAQGGRTLAPQATPLFKGVKAAKTYTHSRYQSSSRTHVATAGGATFRTAVTDSSRITFASTLRVTYKGTTKTIATGVDGEFATNGRFVIYAKSVTPIVMRSGGATFNTYKSNIYRLDLKTGAKKRIATGKDWVVYGANASYVYCGGRRSSVVPSAAYAVKVKTRAKRKLVNPSPAQLESANGRIAYTTMRLQVCASKLYVAKANGTGKKLVAEMAGNFRISGKKIIYLQGKYSNGSMYYRVMRCSLYGGSKKALTSWKKEQYPNSPYFTLLKRYNLETS